MLLNRFGAANGCEALDFAYGAKGSFLTSELGNI